MTPFDMAELRRLFSSFIAFGRVARVSDDGTRATVIVENGLETPFLRTLKRRAKGDTENWPLEKDEQVVCLFPNGAPSQGVILGSILTRDGAPTGKGHGVTYADGASYSYDKATKVMRVSLPEGGRLQLEVAGGAVNLKAPKVVVEASDVALGSEDAAGLIVTTEAICAFTGLPHPQGAKGCRAKHA